MNSAHQHCSSPASGKILVATDRSEFSEGAIREAISLAKKNSSSLYIISVLETNPEYETIGANFFQIEEEEAIKYLGALRKRASQEGLHCQSMLFHGNDPGRLITNSAAERMVDMISIGRRGWGKLVKLLMRQGGVTAKVIGHAPCKVLVVPKTAVIEHRKLLVAVDGSDHSTAAASEAVEIAKRCGSHIVAVSAARSETKLKEAKNIAGRVVDAARKNGIQAEALTPVGRPGNVILKAAEGRAIDLIVMGTYGQKGLRKLLMGSTTEKVVNFAECAVLVVRKEKILDGFQDAAFGRLF